MADVFISYKSERRSAAEHLAETLTHWGYSVWFDHSLVHGRDFGLQLDREIRAAKVVVVLWCTLAVGSRWVHEEVDLASELGILLPTKIEPCELPVGNRRLDYIDLSNWDGSPRSSNIDDLLLAISGKVGRDPAPNFQALKQYDDTWRRFGALSLRSFALSEGLEARSDQSSPTNKEDKEIQVLHAIWLELRESANLERLRFFLDQVRRTPIEQLVEERVELLEREYSSADTANWLRQAREALPQIRDATQFVQYPTDPDTAKFDQQVRAAVAALPPLTRHVDIDEAEKLLSQFINRSFASGNPIPDSYEMKVVLPRPGQTYKGKPVLLCARPGVAVEETVRREGYGPMGGYLVVEPVIQV